MPESEPSGAHAEPSAAPSTFTYRMLGAAFLKVAVYEEVEADSNATFQAAGVVGIVALAGALAGIRGGTGGLLTGLVGPYVGAVLAGLVSAYLGWALWSGTCYLVGTQLFTGTASWGELLRTIGFAQAPGILLVLGAVDGLAAAVSLIVYLWLIATVFVAIRQALDFGTGRALASTLAGFVPYAVVKALTELVLGIEPMILP